MKNKEYDIYVVSGVEGPSVYLNDRRIAGPKPWGGGKIVYRWKTYEEDLRMAKMTPTQLQNYVQNRVVNNDGTITTKKRTKTPVKKGAKK